MKFTPPPGVGTTTLPRHPRIYYTRTTKNGFVVQSWPQGRPKWTKPRQFARDQMYVSAKMVQDAMPVEIESAKNFEKNSADTWKDILTRAQFGTLFKVVAPDGTECTISNKGYVPPPPTPIAQPMWTLVKAWDFAVNGAVASVDLLNADQYDEILWVCVNVTLSVAGQRTFRCSVNNGVSWFSGGSDYKQVRFDSGENNFASALTSATSTTAAQGGFFLWRLMSQGNGHCHFVWDASSTLMWRFVGSNSPVNGIRYFGTAGNLNGGHIQVYAR